MSASRDVIAALVAGGMDPIEASTLLARAAVEMTSIVLRKSPGAKRQERWRERKERLKASPGDASETDSERLKASQSVSGDATADPGERASRSVSKRLEASQRDAQEKPPLTYFLPLEGNISSEKKESKKERSPKKRDGPLPADWTPPARSFAIAAEHGTTVPHVEAIFRDYLASSGKRYADYDAAFCNFVRNQRNFNGGKNGQGSHNQRPAAAAGAGGSSAADRETDFVSSVGNGALNYLKKRESARSDGQVSGNTGAPKEHDDFDGAEDDP